MGLAEHPLADASALCNILAILRDTDALVVTEMMLSLEAFQVQLAVCKVQRAEEGKKTAGSEFMNLFKLSPNVPAAALTKLDETARAVAKFRQSTIERWPASAADYNIEEIVAQVKVLWQQHVDVTLSMWSSALIKAKTIDI